MNAKEEILRELKARKYELKKEITSMLKDRFSEDCIEYKIVNSFLERIESLITAVENAIFDVPSEEEIEIAASKMWYDNESYQLGFEEGCILNYKKPKTDGK
jgi:hypothetical protein